MQQLLGYDEEKKETDYYLDLIKMYKQTFWGAQDEKLTKDEDMMVQRKLNEDKYQNNLKFIEQRSFNIDLLKKGHRPNYELNQLFKLSSDEHIKNIKISNTSNIYFVELQLGGFQADKIYSKTFNALRDLYGMDSDVIPFYMCKNGIPSGDINGIRIYIECSDTFELKDIVVSADIYKNNNESKTYDTLMFSLQCDGEYLCKTGNTREIVNYNHPIYYILVDTMYSDVFLQCYSPNNCLDKIPLKLYKTIDDINIYRLTDDLEMCSLHKYGINFSRIDRAELSFNCNKDNLITCIYAISLNNIVFNDGRFGMAFSK